MPNERQTRKRNNLNLNLCFRNRMQLFRPKPAPPSPISSSNFNNITMTQQNPFPSLGPEPADLATAFASQRFFFTSPGRSNSIVESTNNTDADCTTSSSSPSVTTRGKIVLNDSVAVMTYSPNPYADFRRSMEEMVAARPELMDVASNWRDLHELLIGYLALNPKSTHQFILNAFYDLLVHLVSASASA
ncbi:hypothetical protein VNO78_17340 [Psophocarpus tetragonolobus]|uniref:Transcription repressor n=1 Tax=Psophocarpus tetragonolobus TaxID=3891 RepID=A0AAN9SH87_PSOTE